MNAYLAFDSAGVTDLFRACSKKIWPQLRRGVIDDSQTVKRVKAIITAESILQMHSSSLIVAY